MFRTLIYPSSGACDCVDELLHRLSCSQFVVCWRFGNAGFEWCSFYRLKPATRTPHKKWNKIASDIKLVFHSSTDYICSCPSKKSPPLEGLLGLSLQKAAYVYLWHMKLCWLQPSCREGHQYRTGFDLGAGYRDVPWTSRWGVGRGHKFFHRKKKKLYFLESLVKERQPPEKGRSAVDEE